MAKNINFVKVFSKIKTLFQTNKKRSLTIFVVLILIFFIFAYLYFPKNTDNKNNNESSMNDYARSIEFKLEEMLLAVYGIDSVDVFVMTAGTQKINYLMETTETEVTNSTGSTKTSSSKVVYEKLNGETLPIIVSTSYPEILGVMIVTNSISASTKNLIKNSISIVLNIDSSCISILQEW